MNIFKRGTAALALGLAVSLIQSVSHAAPLAEYSASRLSASQDAGKTTVLAFHTSWCPICMRQNVVLERLTDQNPALEVLKVDFDGDKPTDRKYGVKTQSTLLLIKGGREVARLVGEHREERISTFLKGAQ
jgi:thioredoxin 1